MRGVMCGARTSLLGSNALQPPPPLALANRDQLPLWHSVYFRNEFNCSYYNTKMIRQGVLTWGQL